MPLIEGIGDEVVQFVGVVLLVVVAALAWWSTNARPDRYRTVLVMRPRTHPVTVSIRAGPNLVISSVAVTRPAQPAAPNVNAPSTSNQQVNESTRDSPRDNARVIPLQEMDSIVDADMAMMDNNRLHFYRRVDAPTSPQNTTESTSEESETPVETDTASNAQIREMESIVNAMEADVTAGPNIFNRQNESNATAVKDEKPKQNNEKSEHSSTSNAVSDEHEENTNVNEINQDTERGTRRILIKLKYLNDTLKEVEGNLDELLKDFKWRHFASELTSECRVRLIFNGRVLLDDAATLGACGLHDRAVVHCLVHPKRNNVQRVVAEEPPVGATHELVSEPPPDRAWDLENILMTLVSVALTVVWFFRCEYSNLFTASASVALFGLTVFYSVAIFGLYLSDTFHFDRRPQAQAQAQSQPQPQPVNNN